MTDADVVPASQVQFAAFDDLDRRLHEEPMPVDDVPWDRVHLRMHHLVANDAGGAWVGELDGTIVGCALALKRETYWGLSLLVVDPASQSTGVGRRLLDATLAYADGCDRAVIVSSPDPRAMRAYSTSGFDLHPQVEAKGEVDRAAIPALHGRVRAGSLDDVEFADGVDRLVRGAPRGPDHVRMATDLALFITDDVDGQGYAYVRSGGEIMCLAATNDDTATALLWRCFAHTRDLGKPASLSDLNGQQQWAISACFTARMKLRPIGPVFWRGSAPPGAYVPSGAFL